MFNNEEAIVNWLKNKKNSRTLEAGDIKPQQRITGSSLLKSIQQRFLNVKEKQEMFNQKSYHGSGAQFSKFDLGYAGSGEGGAASSSSMIRALIL